MIPQNYCYAKVTVLINLINIDNIINKLYLINRVRAFNKYIK